MKIENGFKARRNTIRMNIVNALTSLFSLQMGEFRFWRTTDCLDILYSDSPFPTNEGCYFENPGAPYGLLMLPPHNEEALDEYWGYPVSDGNLSATWHMKPTDVLVLAGRTPPPCSYFGFTNYLYSRHFPDEWSPTSPHSIWNCPVGDRCEIFASLDDSVNLHRGLNLPHGMFDQSMVLVISPSVEPMDAVVDALVASGIDAAIISSFSLPGAELRLGVGRDDDTLTMLMRMAFFDEDDEPDYFDASPFDVFRVSYSNSTPVTPFERQPLVDRYTGYTDASPLDLTMAQLERDVHAVALHISTHTNHTTLELTQTESSIPDSGFDCIANGRLCLADCRDTHYPFTVEMYRRLAFCRAHWNDTAECPRLMNATLASSDVLYVVGVNHALTNMSSYMSVAIYDVEYFWGVSAVGNEALQNSAVHFVQTNLTDTMNASLPYIYVYEFRRECGDRPYCLSIPYSPGDAFIPLDDPVAITERLYDNPLTHVGADSSSVVAPYVIHIRNAI